MDIQIVRFEEFPDWDVVKRMMISRKRVVYTIDGSEHSVSMSMEDFKAGKAKQIVDEEIKKIGPVFELSSAAIKKK